MQLRNLLLQIFRVFDSRLFEPSVGTQKEKDVLRDFIDCGVLGDSDKRECIWGCDWKPNPLYPLDYDEKFELIFQKINYIGTVLQQLEFNLFDLNKAKIMLKLLL